YKNKGAIRSIRWPPAVLRAHKQTLFHSPSTDLLNLVLAQALQPPNGQPFARSTATRSLSGRGHWLAMRQMTRKPPKTQPQPPVVNPCRVTWIVLSAQKPSLLSALKMTAAICRPTPDWDQIPLGGSTRWTPRIR